MAFGNGMHFCLGVHLARLEGRIAVGTMLDKPPEFGPHPALHKMETLEVRLLARA